MLEAFMAQHEPFMNNHEASKNTHNRFQIHL
jgi:hypothetical protein